MKKIIIAIASISLFASCTVGEGGSGHRLEDSTQAKIDKLGTPKEFTVKVIKTGAIMKVSNPSGIKLIPGDSVLVTKNDYSGDWHVYNGDDLDEVDTWVTTDSSADHILFVKARILLR